MQATVEPELDANRHTIQQVILGIHIYLLSFLQMYLDQAQEGHVEG